MTYVQVAYTFDAGPNACVYLLESEVDEFISLVNYVFPKPKEAESVEYFRGLPLSPKPCKKVLK